MQERQVSLAGETHRLPEPFLVLATQNPIEQEGTYPLPEAQVDRFMLKVLVSYPSRKEEREMLGATVNKVYIDERVKDYCLDIIQATREPAQFQLENIRTLVRYGASPRA